METRIYTIKDAEMLFAAKSIIESLEENISDFKIHYSYFTPIYLKLLSDKIEFAINNYIGLDYYNDNAVGIKNLDDSEFLRLKKAIMVLNEIYMEITGICKIGMKIYPIDSPKFHSFKFIEILKNIGLVDFEIPIND